MEHIVRLNLDGPEFADLAREALEAEYGGEIVGLLKGIDQSAIQDPGRFASELYKNFGTEAMKYYVTIIKYAESGRFQPEEEAELATEEEELGSLIRDIDASSDEGTGADPSPTEPN